MAALALEADPRLCGKMVGERDVPLEGDPRERLLLKRNLGPDPQRPGDSWQLTAEFLTGMPGLIQDPLSQYIRFDSSFERLPQ